MSSSTPTSKPDLLTQWARQNGASISEKVKFIWNTDGSGLTAQATSPIDPDDVLIQCPESLIMGPKVAKSLFSNTAQPFIKLALLHEQSLGDKSQWYTYISALPKPGSAELGVPLYFDEQDLVYIQGTNLGSDLDHKRARIQSELAELTLALGSCPTYLTLENYTWASAIFASRAFPASIIYANCTGLSMLVPIVDALNHKANTPVQWHGSPTGEFCLVADGQIPAGDQIYNNYGPKGNEELLMGYGFTVENNPFDVVRVRPASYSSKDDDFAFNLTRDQPVPEELVNLFVSSHESENPDCPHGLTLYRGYSSLEDEFKRIYNRNYQHKATNSAPPANMKQQYAQWYREGQLEILGAAIKFCQQAKDELKHMLKIIDINTMEEDHPEFIQHFLEACQFNNVSQLLECGMEDTIALCYVALQIQKGALPIPSTSPLSSDEQEYLQELCDTTLAHPTLKGLATWSWTMLAPAAAILHQSGLPYLDKKGRERFKILLEAPHV